VVPVEVRGDGATRRPGTMLAGVAHRNVGAGLKPAPTHHPLTRHTFVPRGETSAALRSTSVLRRREAATHEVPPQTPPRPCARATGGISAQLPCAATRLAPAPESQRRAGRCEDHRHCQDRWTWQHRRNNPTSRKSTALYRTTAPLSTKNRRRSSPKCRPSLSTLNTRKIRPLSVRWFLATSPRKNRHCSTPHRVLSR